MIPMSTKEIKLLLETAIAECAVKTSAKLFNMLAGEYIEGNCDDAGNIFNELFPKASLEIKIKFVYTTPFRSTANKIATSYGIQKPWIETSDKPWEWIPNTIA